MDAPGYNLGELRALQDWYFDDIKNISLGTYKSIPIKIPDVATVQMSSDLRLGITEQNGEGEVVRMSKGGKTVWKIFSCES